MSTRAASRDRLTAWALQVRHLEALRDFTRACDRAGIDVLPVKGIVSARTLYDDVADRPLTDVDVRIRPRDFDRVLALGRREGWRVFQRMRAYRNVGFVLREVMVDVESFPGPPGLCRVTVDDMIARATRSDVFGFPHLLPDFDDHALVLVQNVFKDKFIHAFAWSLKDVERIPERAEFDAQRLVGRLREAGCATVGWVVADWMARERGVAAWAEVRERIARRPPRARYVRAMQWLRSIEPRGQLALRVLARAAADRPVDRARALARMVWWQAETVTSRLGDAPLKRTDPATLGATIYSKKVQGKR